MNSNQFQPLYRLPKYGPIVGRKAELFDIEEFLKSQNEHAQSVLLIYGPRGIGKSALVCEAARLAFSNNLFETVLWLDRSRIEKILEVIPNGIFGPYPNPKSIIQSLTNADLCNIVDDFLAGKHDSNITILQSTVALLKEVLNTRPYLLIIDDFDEYCTLRDLPGLCEQLSFIPTSSKVILTSRTNSHKFSYPVYRTYALGALELADVKGFTCQLCGYQLERYQLINGDSAASAEYIVKIAGGMPEFIKRFFLPMLEQTGQVLHEGYDWNSEFLHFAADYLIERCQGVTWERYQERYDHNLECFNQLSATLTNLEKNILFALTEIWDNSLRTANQLAESLGYQLKTVTEQSEFRRCIQRLHDKRFIARHLSPNPIDVPNDSSHKAQLIEQWCLPTPIKTFLKKNLLVDLEAEHLMWNEQIDRWIQYLDEFSQPPLHIIKDIQLVLTIFRKSYDYKEFQKSIDLGELLCKVSNDRIENSKFVSEFVEIHDKTAQAAFNLGKEILAAKHWLWLAQYYLATDLERDDTFALEYASKVIQSISDKVDLDDNSHIQYWIEANYVSAKVQLRRKNLEQTAKYLSDIETRGLHQQYDWALLAHELASAYTCNGNETPLIAWEWLNRSYKSAINCSAHWVVAQVEVKTADRLLAEGAFQKSVKFAQSARCRIDQVDPSKFKKGKDNLINNYEILIKAFVIEAQATYRLEDTSRSVELLKEALEIAEREKLHPLVTVINNSLIFVQGQSKQFNPAMEVSIVLGVKLYWGIIENQEICIACRKKLILDDFINHSFWICPQCNASYHTKCIRDLNEYRCPNCQTTIAIE